MAPSRYDLGANELASMLSGSTLPIPNLKVPLANFPKGVNKYMHEIRQWVDRLIDELVYYSHTRESSILTSIGTFMMEENVLVSSVVILDISQLGKKCSHKRSWISTNRRLAVVTHIQSGKS